MAAGILRFMFSNVATSSSAKKRLRSDLSSAGTTYQGALGVLVADRFL
ncbi:MAG: hypothetical protein RL520_859 [Pseudomonadota bacterium]